MNRDHSQSYSISKKVNSSFSDALVKTKIALSKEGFGVLTEIDVKKTLKNKLGVEWKNYVILGACNPPLAFKALQIEIEIGLLLPCNVIVYENTGDVFVSAIQPSVVMQVIENTEITLIAKEVEEKLHRVINSL
jgi:uncharacterized protein (DUF302 family)